MEGHGTTRAGTGKGKRRAVIIDVDKLDEERAVVAADEELEAIAREGEEYKPFDEESDFGFVGTHKHWFITLNNPSADQRQYLWMREYWEGKVAAPWGKMTTPIVWFFGQFERAPTTGTLHLQATLSARYPIRGAAVQRVLGGHAACFRRRGSAQQCREYCSKRASAARDVAAPFEFGLQPRDVRRGQRSDLERACDLVAGGVHPALSVARHMPRTFVQYGRGLGELAAALDPARDEHRDVAGYFFLGSPGTGKTTQARRIAGPGHYFGSADAKWLHHYAGQERVVIDELAPKVWSYERALQVLGGDPWYTEHKGSGWWFRADFVIITSNVESVGELFPNADGSPRADCDALLRRSRVVRFRAPLVHGGFVRVEWERAHPLAGGDWPPQLSIDSTFRPHAAREHKPRDAFGRIIKPAADAGVGGAAGGAAAGAADAAPARGRQRPVAQTHARGARPPRRFDFIDAEAGVDGPDSGDDEDGCMNDPYDDFIDDRDNIDERLQREYDAWQREQA